MPPLPIPTGTSRTSRITSHTGPSHILQFFLLAFLITACIRLATRYYVERKSREAIASGFIQEKKPHSTEVLRKQFSTQTTQTRYTQQPQQDISPNTITESQETLVFRPVYPWTGPPQPLPGPYDPRLYPLPTIRRHSHAVQPSFAASEETSQILYTRRVSTNSLPTHEITLQGIKSTSTKGWRRNQWVVMGG